MDYEKREQVVFVKDLLFAALYRWRSMLAALLIGAILFGAGAAIISYQSTKNTPSLEVQQESISTYEKQKTALENQLTREKTLVANQMKYLEEAPVMNIDPYCVYRATIDLYIQTDYQILPEMTYQNPDETAAILSAYQVYLSGDQVIHAVANDINLESKYLWEVITLTNGGSTNRNLKITINYPTAEGAEKIRDAFLSQLEQAQEPLGQTVGAHTAQVVSSRVDQRIDFSFTDLQTAAESRLEKLRKQQTTTKEKLDGLQKPVFDKGISTKTFVILVILGGVLGAGLIACIAWFKHLSGNTVYSHRTLVNKTGLKVLACIPKSEIKNSIDKWLRKAEGRTEDQAMTEVAIATIRNYSTPGQRLLLLGDCPLALQEQFAQGLKASGIDAVACGDLLSSATAQNALPEGDLVVFVEACGVSRYNNIIMSMEQLEDLDKPLIGCILLGG